MEAVFSSQLFLFTFLITQYNNTEDYIKYYPESGVNNFHRNIANRDTIQMAANTSTVKMEMLLSEDSLVASYETTWCHNPEDHSMNLHRHGNLTSIKPHWYHGGSPHAAACDVVVNVSVWGALNPKVCRPFRVVSVLVSSNKLFIKNYSILRSISVPRQPGFANSGFQVSVVFHL
jgi:hypothetical protein